MNDHLVIAGITLIPAVTTVALTQLAHMDLSIAVLFGIIAGLTFMYNVVKDE